MKKSLLFLSVIFSTPVWSQDSTLITKPSTPKIIAHEFGGNITLLLKQVFNLSNNTFPTLPYDLTYKRICNSSAIRIGLGITMNNSTVKATETTSGINTPPPGPDLIIPTTNKSFNIFYRAGWEKRFELEKRILAYGGIDLVGQYGYSNSASSEVFNNLPSNYSYTRTTDDINTIAFGVGPVAGIQIFLTKKLSLFTEMPLYFTYTIQNEVTDFYQNSYNSFTGTYVSQEDKQTVDTNGNKLTLTLPVTLYLCLKF